MRITLQIAAGYRPERAPHRAEHVHFVRVVDWASAPRRGDHLDLAVGAPANIVEVKETTFQLDGSVTVRTNWMPLNLEDIDELQAQGWQRVET